MTEKMVLYSSRKDPKQRKIWNFMEAGDFMTKAGKAGNICKIMSLSGIIPVSGISFCLVQKKYLTMPIWQKYPKL